MRIAKIGIAFVLLWFVFYGSVPSSINIINPVPTKIDEAVEIINVAKPSEDILSKVKPISIIVTDIEDRVKLALFNYEFASRVMNYETDAQQINDVYTKAAKLFFEDQLKGKYANFADGIKQLFVSVLSEDNHTLNMEEKQKLKDLFTGLSWSMLEK
jgi:hypothetical protein